VDIYWHSSEKSISVYLLDYIMLFLTRLTVTRLWISCESIVVHKGMCLQGGEFECVDCTKNFKLKSSLERHRRVIHLEGDTYSCPECEARCPDKGTLARHMYTHTGE
jgi:hypothetical protein